MKALLQKATLITTLMASTMMANTALANTKSTLIDGNSTQAILTIAKTYGEATLEKDGMGDPKISADVDGTEYGIYFYACDNGKNCEYIKFTTGYDTNGKTKLKDINQWNNNHSIGRAMLDEENDVLIDYAVVLHKGVSKDNLQEVFEYWLAILESAESDLVKFD